MLNINITLDFLTNTRYNYLTVLVNLEDFMSNYTSLAQQFCTALEGKDCKKIGKLLDNGYKGIFVILRILSGKQDGCSAGDLANTIGISTARIAVAIKTLTSKDYITRIKSSDDKRKVVIKITSKGQEALRKRENEVFDVIVNLIQKLSPTEAEDFIRLSKKLLS